MFLSEWREFPSAPCLAGKKKNKTWWELASRCCWNRARPWQASELVSYLAGLRTYQHLGVYIYIYIYIYRGTVKSLARAGGKQANVSLRMAWIFFGSLSSRKKTWWQLASLCCWNRARPWRASELVSFLVGLRTYQRPFTDYHTIWTNNLFVIIYGLLFTQNAPTNFLVCSWKKWMDRCLPSHIQLYFLSYLRIVWFFLPPPPPILPQPEINIALPLFKCQLESPLHSLFCTNFKSRHWLIFPVKANKLAGLDPRAQCFLLTPPSVLIQTAFLMIQCDFYCCSISPHFLPYGPQQYTPKIRITTVLLLYRDLLSQYMWKICYNSTNYCMKKFPCD